MPRLREVMTDTGMPQDDFIVVPNESYNVVWLEGASGSVAVSHDAKITVETVNTQSVSRIAERIVRHHSAGVGDIARERYQKALWARMHDLTRRHPGQVFAIRGKAPGWGKLKVRTGGRTIQADVGVSQQSFVEISFRFLRHKGPDGRLVPDTVHGPDAASAWVDTLNWIYGPQANVNFDLFDTDWVTLPQAPNQPIGRDFFLQSIATNPSPTADITVYLVGQWGGGSGGDSRGSYFDNTGIAVVTDRPQQDEIPEGIDVFMLTMAHEILHYLRESRKLPPGHHSRDRVLLSDGIQTLRIDKQLVLDINPPG